MTLSLPWRSAPMAIVGVLLGIALLHLPTVAQTHRFWSDPDNTTYTHGYLILAISAWLLWRRLRSWKVAVSAPVPAALALLALAEAAWLTANQAGIEAAGMLLLPIIAWLALFTCLGSSAARLVRLPLAYLYFALPIWSMINAVPQQLTVYATRVILSVLGISATFAANRVYLPAGTFEIEGGCSGLHFIIVALAVATMLGELRDDTTRVRLKLMGLALLFAIATNWIRVSVIIIAGYLTDMQHYLVSVSHYGFGWVLFGLAMALFFFAERRIQPGIPAKVDAAGAADRPARFAGLATLVWLMAGAIVATPMTASALVFNRHLSVSGALRTHYGDWDMTPQAVDTAWRPVFLGADAEARHVYAHGDERAEIYIAWYETQAQGRELGGFSNSIVGDLPRSGEATPEAVDGRPFTALQVTAPHGVSETVWYSYSVGDRWFRSATRAQLWYAFQSLLRLQPPISRVVIAKIPCGSDCGTANRSITTLLREID